MRQVIHLIRVLVGVALIATAFSGCSAKAKKTRYLDRANRDFDCGHNERAEIEYLNVLQLEPRERQATKRLGVIYFTEGRLGRAFPFLSKAREYQPDDAEVRLKLGLLYAANGKWKEAREEAKSILMSNTLDAGALRLLAEASLQPEEIDESRNRIQELISAHGETTAALIALGTLDLRERKLEEAEALFQRAQTADPISSAPSSALGALYWAKKDLGRAEQAFVAAAELEPANSAQLLQLAKFRLQGGNSAGAQRDLEKLTRSNPDHFPARIMLGEIAVSENRYADAEALLAKLLARDPIYPEALLLNGRVKLAKGEKAKAISEFQKVLRIYPHSAQAYYQLGIAQLANGEISPAISSLNQAILLAPGYAEPVVLLAGINIRRGDLSRAIAALKPLIIQHPELAQARLLLADAYRAQGDFDDALSIYREMESLFLRNPQIAWLSGLIFLQQGKKEPARQSFERAIEQTPDYLPAVEQLVNLDLAEKNHSSALQRVNDQVTRNPNSAQPYLLLAQVFLAQNDTNQTEVALRKVIELQPESPAGYYSLARLYIRLRQEQKALQNLREILAKKPQDLPALMLAAAIYEEEKDYEAARDTYEKLLAINPQLSTALNNLAYLYSERFGQLDKAYEMARRARELLPYEPNTADTLGWILYLKHQYPWSLSLLEESAGKLPESAEAQFHLGMVHFKMGEEESARLALERAVQLGNEFPGIEQAKTALWVLAIDPAVANGEIQTTLEKLTAKDANNPVAFCRLASIYAREGATDKALEAYQAALRNNPETVTVLIKLIGFYTDRRDNAKAFEYAKAARNLAPDNPYVASALKRLSADTTTDDKL